MKLRTVHEATHSRLPFVLLGCVIAVVGMMVLLLGTALDAPAGGGLLVAGYGLGFLTFGALLTVATPATGPLPVTLVAYRLCLASLVVPPLLGSLPILSTRYWPAAVALAPIPLVALYFWVGMDWHAVRAHLETIRASDPESVRFVTPERNSLLVHAVFAVLAWLVAVVVGIFAWFSGSVAGGLVTLALLLVAGIAPLCVPSRGSIERTALAFCALFVGPGVCLLVAGPTLVLEGARSPGWLVVAALLTAGGLALSYLGYSWLEMPMSTVLAEVRRAESVTWQELEPAVETIRERERREQRGR